MHVEGWVSIAAAAAVVLQHPGAALRGGVVDGRLVHCRVVLQYLCSVVHHQAQCAASTAMQRIRTRRREQALVLVVVLYTCRDVDRLGGGVLFKAGRAACCASPISRRRMLLAVCSNVCYVCPHSNTATAPDHQYLHRSAAEACAFTTGKGTNTCASSPRPLPAQGSYKYHQFQVVGRHLPTDKEPEPPVYRMKLWAQDPVCAKSKFWYFLRKLRKVKKANGQILSCNEVWFCYRWFCCVGVVMG